MRMKSKLRQLRARDYINDLAASGHYHFLSNDAREALGVSAAATKLALNRLGRQNMIPRDYITEWRAQIIVINP